MLDTTRPTGSPFLRFNAITGWPLGAAEHRSGIPDLGAALQLGIPGRSAIAMAEPKGTFGGLTLPRGLAISPNGRIFMADTHARVIWTALADAASGPRPADAPDHWPFQALWPARPLPQAHAHDLAPPPAVPVDPYTLLGPTDVALAPNGDLVILDPAAHRILVLAFPTAALRQVIQVEGGTPTAIAFDHHGQACIADPGRKTVHRFDHNWRLDTRFSPFDPADPDTPSAPDFIAAADSLSCCNCGCNAHHCRCESELPCGPREPDAPIIYTLDKRGKLHAIYADGRMATVVDPDALSLRPRALTLAANGALLYHDPALPNHDPIRIEGLELTGDGRHAGTGLPLLARPRRVEVPRSGHFITDALDAGIPGFAWHRIALRLEMPQNTRLVMQTMTSDSAIEADRIEVQPASAWSLPLVLKPGDSPATPLSSAAGRDLWPELLIQSPPGRYLWLRADLSGDGSHTPAIHELDLFGPRHSALADLPAPFHQDPDSAHFLDRFLSYFDTVFAEITTRNRDIATLFDPATTPAAGGFLSWLGAWFDLQFLAEWDEATRREMVAEAIIYFRMRGTVDGLRKIVQWHTGLSDPLPQVIEHFRLPTGNGGNQAPWIGGSPLEVGNPAHSFTVVLPASSMPDEIAQARLIALIAASIPAHCRFHIRSFTPGIEIGRQSSIGVDTLLGSLDPSGLGLGLLGSTLSTPGPGAIGPVTVYPGTQGTCLEGGQPC